MTPIEPRIVAMAAYLIGQYDALADEGHADFVWLPNPTFTEYKFAGLDAMGITNITYDEYLDALWLASRAGSMLLESRQILFGPPRMGWRAVSREEYDAVH